MLYRALGIVWFCFIIVALPGAILVLHAPTQKASSLYTIEQWDNNRWVKIGETKWDRSSTFYPLTNGARYTPTGKWRIYKNEASPKQSLSP